jgi:tetratricopeptide (TPR) repeat protein
VPLIPSGDARHAERGGTQGGTQATTPAPADKIDAILEAVLPLRNSQEWGKAEALLNESIRQYPQEQVLYLQLGEVLAIQRKSEEAYANFEKALVIGPREPEIEMAAGTVASDAGKTDRAEEHFQAAQAARKSDWQPSLFLAQVQMKRGEFDEAKKNLMLAAGAKPDLAIAWGSLAEVLLRENAVGPALQNIAKARQLEPDTLAWRMIEARALKRNAQPDAALQLLVGLDDTTKLQQGVLPLMGECFGLLKRPGDAAAQYAKVSDRFADRADIALEAARWFERAGDKPKALDYARRAQYLGDKDAEKLAAELSK